MNLNILLCLVLVATISCNPIVEAGGQDWWQTAVFYQIYPRSFKDSDNNGIGDLQGIISKLDHLKDAGVTATWLSPIYKSPGVDQGYDISDYRDIDPIFGTLEDFKQLLAKAKELGIKVILDYVPNHTSDEHEWFKKSLENDNEYNDYFIWAEGRNNNTEPPNNWVSHFKGPAWTFRKERGLWYLNKFAPQQPDLNYRNPKVVQAMKDVLNFWMDLGVDGFRVDTIPDLFEVEDLRDEPRSDDASATPNDYEYLSHIYTQDLDETYDMVYQWRELLDEHQKTNGGDTRVLMTEVYSDFEKNIKYYGLPDGSRRGAHFSFNFELIVKVNEGSSSMDILTIIDRWVDNLPEIYTPNWVLGNHDQHRYPSRLGPENRDSFMMLQSMLPGVQVTYNGEEIGMEDGQVSCDEGADPQAIKNCSIFDAVSRDFERTPFQWDESVNAGFNDGGRTWLPVSDKYLENNLKKQKEGVRSYYNTFKSLIDIRKELTLKVPTKTALLKESVMAISRPINDCRAYHFLYNRHGDTKEVDIPYGLDDSKYTVVASKLTSQHIIGDEVSQQIKLDPNDSLIVRETC
ncbi:unnamed protein product [Brassicogethes aeneus]|uniref:alpha-glucosidase n=1 Tax=Brassicogethes aeneus TaxID=1431903 RepID=A0A9P0AYL4_BRAAE|nr:unnamed protein product [Brassicogethes aeneus]